MDDFNITAMETALRVLTAMNQRQRPNALDVRDLRAYANAGSENFAPDELACEIIERALKNGRTRSGACAA